MIERLVTAGVVTVVAVSMLATVLPRVTPSLLALGLLVLLGRLAWFYTR